MKTIEIIKREHRNLTAVLYTLKRLAVETEEGHKDVEFRVFHGILYYLDSFLDRYHHPKESSHLFPMVAKRAPEAAEIVKQLGKEHAKEEELMNELLRSLSAYEFLGKSGYPRFRNAVETYVEFEQQHALKEEKELMPIAVECLTEADWRDIDAVFLDHSDPLFGDEPSNEFSELYSTLTRIVPEPYGLGQR